MGGDGVGGGGVGGGGGGGGQAARRPVPSAPPGSGRPPTDVPVGFRFLQKDVDGNPAVPPSSYVYVRGLNPAQVFRVPIGSTAGVGGNCDILDRNPVRWRALGTPLAVAAPNRYGAVWASRAVGDRSLPIADLERVLNEGANQQAPENGNTRFKVNAYTGGSAVRITRTPARFAPGVEPCPIAYQVTGTFTAARVEVKDRAGTLVARLAPAPSAAGNQTFSWDGRLNQGPQSGQWASPHGSPFEVKVHADPSGHSHAASVAVEVHSLAVTDAPPDAAHPERLMRPAAGSGAPHDGDPFVELTARVQLKRTNNTGTVAPVRVGVDWTFDAPSGANGNCPGSPNNGKARTDRHFAAAAGFGTTPGGNEYAWNYTNDRGESKVIFRASQVAGDKFTLIARVLQDPVGRTGAVLKTTRSRRYEVWRQFTYANLFQIPGGVDVGPVCTEANIQPPFTPAFTKYNRTGTPRQVTNATLTGDHLALLLPPTGDSELPRTSRVRARSAGALTRSFTITVRGKVRTTGASGEATGTRDDAETLALNATTTQADGTKQWHYVSEITLSPAAESTITIEQLDGSAGNQVAMFSRGSTRSDVASGMDTNDVSVLAQAWADRNWDRINANVRALESATSTDYCLVGGKALHPKHDGRAGNYPAGGRTSFYAGYDIDVQPVRGGPRYHPDAPWYNYLGWNDRKISVIFAQAGSALRVTVAQHEIAHGSDHHHFGNAASGARRDHCNQDACLMAQNAGHGPFCTHGTDHSRKRLMGWKLP